eukprot:gene3383-13421_t
MGRRDQSLGDTDPPDIRWLAHHSLNANSAPKPPGIHLHLKLAEPANPKRFDCNQSLQKPASFACGKSPLAMDRTGHASDKFGQTSQIAATECDQTDSGNHESCASYCIVLEPVKRRSNTLPQLQLPVESSSCRLASPEGGGRTPAGLSLNSSAALSGGGASPLTQGLSPLKSHKGGFGHGTPMLQLDYMDSPDLRLGRPGPHLNLEGLMHQTIRQVFQSSSNSLVPPSPSPSVVDSTALSQYCALTSFNGIASTNSGLLTPPPAAATSKSGLPTTPATATATAANSGIPTPSSYTIKFGLSRSATEGKATQAQAAPQPAPRVGCVPSPHLLKNASEESLNAIKHSLLGSESSEQPEEGAANLNWSSDSPKTGYSARRVVDIEPPYNRASPEPLRKTPAALPALVTNFITADENSHKPELDAHVCSATFGNKHAKAEYHSPEPSGFMQNLFRSYW